MATPTLHDHNTAAETIIAGYFQSGENAHRALHALIDEGFLPDQIGAAFHSAASTALGGDSSRENLGTTVTPPLDSDVSAGGPTSDDTAVQPVGIATGSGSPILGAGKPGPISGSSLAGTGLPSELKRDLPLSAERTGAPISAGPATGINTKPEHRAAPTVTGSWTEKLKHLFTAKPEAPPAANTSQSQNFGTGEGHLGVNPVYGGAYSQTEFEHSVTGYGVPEVHSQHLSHRLAQGGAVITVSARGRVEEAERILERHHGVVRFAGGQTSLPVAPDARVEVFGSLERIYTPVRR